MANEPIVLEKESKKTFTAMEIELTFNSSSSGKSMIKIVDNNIYIVNKPTMEKIAANKIKSITFTRNINPLPKRPNDPAGSPDMYSWSPVEIEATKVAQHELEAIEIESEARVYKAKTTLHQVKTEFEALA